MNQVFFAASQLPQQTRKRARWITLLQSAGSFLAWSYTGLLALWLILHTDYGDTIWWLALLNSFAPFLFAPLLGLLPLGFWVRRRVYWLGLLLPMVSFCLLYGSLFLPAWPAAHAAQPAPLRIMTFNIWGGSRSPISAQVINQNNQPDIVAIQELSSRMMRLIKNEVGHAYPYQLFDPGGGDEGLGIFSRYPLTVLPYTDFFTIGWQVQLVRVQVGDRSFLLYNCHLSSSNVIRYLLTGDSVRQEVNLTFTYRTMLSKRLVADIAARHEPVVVVGDFNSTPESDVYRVLSGSLLDTHQEAGWGFGHTFPARTLPLWAWSIYPRLIRIDLIWHSPTFVALNSQVSAAHGESDHLPVVAQLAWRP